MIRQRSELRIAAADVDEIDAWLYLPDGAPPYPTVVMAHGIGGVKSGGLAPFAEHFVDAGFAAVVFDYRHWGRSSGEPRHLLSVQRQRQDYRTALSWARRHDALDSDRLFIWGTSFAGMHIVELAATEPGLAGAIAQCPLVDGLAAAMNVSVSRMLRLTATALADVAGSWSGREPRLVPISVPPNEFGLIATADAMAGLDRLDPGDGSWPNEITARSIIDITVHRPVRKAHRIRCPILMVVAEQDTMAPTAPAVQVAARAARGELYRSRGGHYDVYQGGMDHANVIRVEVEFLRRHVESWSA
jgi:uncharacterized protein